MKVKSLRYNIVLEAIFLTAIGIACIDLSTKNFGVIIYAFDQNPAGSDDGNEWVTFTTLQMKAWT